MDDRGGSKSTARFTRLSDAGWRERILPSLMAAMDPYMLRTRFMDEAVDIPEDERADAWELLHYARRVTAHHVVGFADQGRSRYIVTPEIGRLLHEVEVLASGRIAHGLERLGGDLQRFASHALMEEAVAESISGGDRSSGDALRRFLHSNRPPSTPLEQKVLNFHQAMLKVPELARGPLSVQTVFDVQRILAHGLVDDEKDATAFRKRNIPVRTAIDEWPEPTRPALARDVERVLKTMIRSTVDQDRWMHPIVRGMMLYFSLLNLRPFEVNNVGLSRTMLQIYLHQNSYESFQLMPVATVLLHRYREYGEAWPDRSEGDITGFVTWALGSVLEALQTLDQWVEDRLTGNEALREQLRFDPTLNHRQRTILGRAIRLPDAEFFIDYHRRSYDLSYSTARADLIGLVDRGYLSVERRSHAFVFSAVPTLADLVAERTRKSQR